MRLILSMASVSLLLAVGCAAAGEAPAPEVDLQAERASLMRADQAWFEAYSTSDNAVETFVGLFVDGAHLLPPDAPLATGEEAIRSAIAGLEAMPGFSLQWSPTLAEVGSGADLGYTMGTYQMRMEDPDGQPIRIDGKYITLWTKQADGTWKVAADMFNADGPPTPVENPEG